MARARNIKPGFFTNEDLAECTPWARLCFAGLWTLADREGRLEDRPKRIKGLLFPSDTIDVEPLLQELARWRFILRYEVDGCRLIQILQFNKHQNPHHREPPSELPPPQSPGLDPVGNTSKPQASPPSQPHEAPGEPEASPRLDPPKSDLARGSSRADSGFRIPDSGSLIPDPGEKPAPELRATPAADACRAMRQAGLQDVNPSHPDLLRLLAAGVTPQELADCAAEAVRTGKRAPFPWVLKTVEGRRHDAAMRGTVPAGAPPGTPETPYQRRARETIAAFAPSLARRPPGQIVHPEAIEAEARDVTPPALG